MQKIAFTVLLAGSLLAGCLLAGPGSVFSQSLPRSQTPSSVPDLARTPGQASASGTCSLCGKTALGWEKSLQLPPMPVYSNSGKLFFPGKCDARNYRPYDPHSEMSVTPVMDSVRILSPDKMRCRVADLTKVEKMPVVRLQNQRPRDPMPNTLRVPGDAAGPLRKAP